MFLSPFLKVSPSSDPVISCPVHFSIYFLDENGPGVSPRPPSPPGYGYALLEKFLQILLYVTDDAIAKLTMWRKV